MITGDNVETAKEIARTIGIMSDGDIALDGEALAQYSDEQLARDVDRIAVYARATPADKLRIVSAWKAAARWWL